MPAVDAIFGMDVFFPCFSIFSLNEDGVPSACRVLALHMSARIFVLPISRAVCTHAPGPKAEAEAVHDVWQ